MPLAIIRNSTRRWRRRLALAAAVLVFAITAHQAIHSTLDIGTDPATPCFFCHVSRTAAPMPITVARLPYFSRVGEVAVAAPVWRAQTTVCHRLTIRPPPSSLLSA
jgi:hypothetical protein